jgi:hypothetical protein
MCDALEASAAVTLIHVDRDDLLCALEDAVRLPNFLGQRRGLGEIAE